MLPKKIYLNYVDENDEDKTWSEEPISVYDCKMQNREYTDLSQVWHDASEEPICGKRLLLLHTNSVVSIFEYTGKSSLAVLVSSGICQYAYINDLLPKGGEK